MDVGALEAAGLYDPGAPDAADRLALLRYLSAAGAPLDEMVAAATDGNLTSLVFDRRLREGERSAADLADASGTTVEGVVDVYRMLGITVADPDERRFDASEVRLFEVLGLAVGSLPDGMAEEVLRAIGTALTLVAETEVSAFVGSVEDLLEQGSARARAEATTMTGELALELGELMQPLLRHHLWEAIQRQRAAMTTVVDRRESVLAIGFVDLVGFTSAVATMSAAELLDFMREFHSRTFDIVTRAGGRVVKHIGDEIMFAAADPDMGCDIALSLIEEFDDVGALPRGGLACGLVVARHGDVYGAVVNLAARLTDIAVPGELLADASIAAAPSAGGCTFEPAGRRQLKGFADPVPVVSVARA